MVTNKELADMYKSGFDLGDLERRVAENPMDFQAIQRKPNEKAEQERKFEKLKEDVNAMSKRESSLSNADSSSCRPDSVNTGSASVESSEPSEASEKTQG
jgi:hypothetical protein